MLEVLFWLAVLVVAYPWLLYPALLAAAAGPVRPPGPGRPRRWPLLSVVVAAHNEAGVIEAKLASALEAEYPPDRLEVIVVSDGSTDDTDARVAACPDPRVRLIRQEPRAGKSSALNLGVAAARGDVLVFTDANALFEPAALARLAAAVAGPGVGLVSGQGLYGDGAGGGPVGNGYAAWEAFLKLREAGLGFVAGADGAVYALRRELYRPLGPAEVNDLLHPIQAALAGWRCAFDPGARTREPASGGAGAELRRHVRIAAQGMALLRDRLPALVAARRWAAVWMLLSHRALRWAAAPALALALLANLGLAGSHPLYALTLAAQLAFHAVAAGALLAERRGRRPGRLAAAGYFWVIALAAVGGLLRYVRWGAEAVWSPRGQTAPLEDRLEEAR